MAITCDVELPSNRVLDPEVHGFLHRHVQVRGADPLLLHLWTGLHTARWKGYLAGTELPYRHLMDWICFRLGAELPEALRDRCPTSLRQAYPELAREIQATWTNEDGKKFKPRPKPRPTRRRKLAAVPDLTDETVRAYVAGKEAVERVLLICSMIDDLDEVSRGALLPELVRGDTEDERVAVLMGFFGDLSDSTRKRFLMALWDQR